MIGWLSDWLRDIIAVILLAVLVELLLPNKAMQRYARLVVGLFILLTILSPLLRLLQEDIGDRLEAGMQLWDERTVRQEIKMPSLEEIQQRAEAIQADRIEEAGRMTAAALEQSMERAIEQETGAVVDAVQVQLRWDEVRGGEKMPVIESVSVTLEAAPPQTFGAQEERRAEVEAIAPVDIQVRAGSEAEQKEPMPAGSGGKRIYVEAGGGLSSEVQGLLARNWGVKPGQTTIRIAASDEAAGS
ncbi:stage III sporulation protein AF [Paenibacillus sp. PL2-23]|uniref:stage III sporulation protein AF n=1 Tax=Paenibacillus sp. PL2-23 TaxID=2100729 RepID=UPI0030F95827